jgi:catechol 2,3-dioxygenase-like lactoylglutathione lyase family enzyme
MKLNFFTFIVKDLNKAKEFFVQVAGLNIITDMNVFKILLIFNTRMIECGVIPEKSIEG